MMIDAKIKDKRFLIFDFHVSTSGKMDKKELKKIRRINKK